MFHLIQNQRRQIAQGGLPILLRKSFRALQLLPAIPIILAIRILHPFVLIRFRQLSSSRIGHFAANTELYLCERDLGMHPKRSRDFFSLAPGTHNRFLKQKWQQQMNISSLAQPLYIANDWLPGGQRHVIPLSELDVNALLPDSEAHVQFTEDEEEFGRAALKEMGVPPGAPFVCFHTRDATFLDATHSYRGWHYHDYRDTSIANCLPAIEKLVEQGNYGIRMGAIVAESLDTSNPMIIDYATKARTDFLDIYLSAKCSFFLGSSAGINSVPKIFRRPIVYANLVPLGVLNLLTCAAGSIFIPMRVWNHGEGRFMTFREIIGDGTRRFFETEEYEALEIETIENTPQEISAVAMEMDQRLKGSWQAAPGDEELQRQFLSIIKPSESSRAIVTRIGSEFLRQNLELLG